MARFDDCLKFLVSPTIEGGYSNVAQDHGGATNYGVTQATYDQYRLAQGLPQQPVSSITYDEVATVYRRGYWDAVRGDELAIPLDVCLFDFAINSGPGRAIKTLQHVVGCAPDGNFGPSTLAAIQAFTPLAAATQLCDAREQFVRAIVAQNPSQQIFLHGWLNRIANLRAFAGLPEA